jgi:hypothetical protein
VPDTPQPSGGLHPADGNLSMPKRKITENRQ